MMLWYLFICGTPRSVEVQHLLYRHVACRYYGASFYAFTGSDYGEIVKGYSAEIMVRDGLG
jgi:hypothetical protein